MRLKWSQYVSFALVIALLSGCAFQAGEKKSLEQHSGPVKVKTNGGMDPIEITQGDHIVPIRTINHTGYVSLDDVAEAMGFNGEWLDDGKFGIGDTDAAYKFGKADSAVGVADKHIRMPAPAIQEGNELYIPASGLKELFGDVSSLQVKSNNVSFFPKPVKENGITGKSLDFGGDQILMPDSNGSMDLTGDQANDQAGEESNDQPRFEAKVSSSTGGKMIAFARKYLGVKYDFGAAPYSSSRRFDRSTFTQHVYGHFGIDLPRVARAQAAKGVYIPRDRLQIGDLMFYYVPNRFKSNKVVGHVGIYMGNGNMIHSSPKPKDGVQITPINKPYWKDTYLYAKRYTT